MELLLDGGGVQGYFIRHFAVLVGSERDSVLSATSFKTLTALSNFSLFQSLDGDCSSVSFLLFRLAFDLASILDSIPTLNLSCCNKEKNIEMLFVILNGIRG
ncbi:hypothetical protein RYX36_010529 [Vicia faba]